MFPGWGTGAFDGFPAGLFGDQQFNAPYSDDEDYLYRAGNRCVVTCGTGDTFAAFAMHKGLCETCWGEGGMFDEPSVNHLVQHSY